MGKSHIVLKLIEIMDDEKTHKIHELEQKLNLRNSTVRGYIYELRYFGYCLESIRGKSGGYKLTKDRKKCYNLDI